MLTFEKFSGINNVAPPERVGASELTTAVNVDIGVTGELRRRAGYTALLETCHKNLHQGAGFFLATVDGGDLVALDGSGGGRVMLYPALGPSRVWYCNLPDGRTTFSNGLISGITDGLTATAWGVPVPEGLGAITPVAGALFPGEYRYQLTHVRLADGLEGGPTHSGAAVHVADGGVLLTGLPVIAGYRINVYLSGHNGEQAFFAGTTDGDSFSYLGSNDALVLPCRTDHLRPPPAGILTAFWRGRVLVADGAVLHASAVNGWEAFDPRRDFKQFGAPITLVRPVDDGIYVGTEQELAFLSGIQFDALDYRRVLDGRVVLGSGVAVRGELIAAGQGAGQGSAMICIAGRGIVAGFGGGNIARMTEGRYVTDVGEVAATFRMTGGVPQYLAVPQ